MEDLVYYAISFANVSIFKNNDYCYALNSDKIYYCLTAIACKRIENLS